jgi:hypothetical protein
MSKKNEYLGRKERKQASRLIANKLSEMGLTDMLTYHPSGKKYTIYFIEGKPVRMTASTAELLSKNPEMKFDRNEDKTLKSAEVDIMQARNIFRNMLKKLRRQPRAAVQAFLDIPVLTKDDSEQAAAQ